MLQLEELKRGVRIAGMVPHTVVTIVDAKWIGSAAVEVIYRDADGRLGSQPLYRDNEPTLELVEAGRPWSFNGDGELFRLVSEAYRIHLAWLFDPYVAITTSLIEPLPHQIAAVYEDMLPRQPLRFLLADDPGAGKTIMAGLLLKELVVRGDLERCLIVSPGSLTEQWQDELWEKFGLDFEVLTRDMITASRTANPFEHKNYLIARMDQLSRNDDLQEKLNAAPEEEMNRAERSVGEGEGQRLVNVGFALMTLQRRLASSPEAIFLSLKRRRERLEARLGEERILLRDAQARLPVDDSMFDGLNKDDWDDMYDEAPQEEQEEIETRLVDHANEAATKLVDVRNFDFGQPGFAQTSSTFHLETLLQYGGPPA